MHVQVPRRLLIAIIMAISALPTAQAETSAPPPATTASHACSEIELSAPAEQEYERRFRCDLLTLLVGRGLALSSPVGQQIIDELRRPYATVLEINGEAALPKSALVYMFQEFPHAARLVNLYSETRSKSGQGNDPLDTKSNYEIIYTRADRSQFFATNNRNMQATVDVIDRFESKASNNYLLFENGQAKLMFWRFAGKSLVDLSLIGHGEQTMYKVKIHLFSNSRVYHAFFESAVFSYLMRSLLRKIVGNLVAAARFLADSSEPPDALDADFVAELRRLLR